MSVKARMELESLVPACTEVVHHPPLGLSMDPARAAWVFVYPRPGLIWVLIRVVQCEDCIIAHYTIRSETLEHAHLCVIVVAVKEHEIDAVHRKVGEVGTRQVCCVFHNDTVVWRDDRDGIDIDRIYDSTWAYCCTEVDGAVPTETANF